jgi:hypothetical protein
MFYNRLLLNKNTSSEMNTNNRKRRKELTQRTQGFECKTIILCDLCDFSPIGGTKGGLRLLRQKNS